MDQKKTPNLDHNPKLNRDYEWFLLKEFNNELDALDCLRLQMPYSSTRNSHTNTNCKLQPTSRHKLKISKRECKGHKKVVNNEVEIEECKVQYKFVQCSICSIYQIFQTGTHSIECENIINDPNVLHSDAQTCGIHPRVKVIIENLIEKNEMFLLPQKVCNYLNEPHIKETIMKGLIVPDKATISYFLRCYKNERNISNFYATKGPVKRKISLT